MKSQYQWAALLSTALIACGAAFAAPSLTYERARVVPAKVNNVIAQTGVWERKPLAVRIQELRAAEQLETTARNLFGSDRNGTYDDCVQAAVALRFYVMALNDSARVLEGARPLDQPVLFAGMRQAIDLGNRNRGCEDALEAMVAQSTKTRR